MDAAARLHRALEEAIGSDAVLRDPADCWTYGYDNSRGQALPAAVVLPGDTGAVQRVVEVCRRLRRPLTVRGRGTGTTGAAVPEDGGVVLSMERMARVLAVDADNRVAVVQAGVTNGALQAAAASAGFFWPPDPGSADYSTVGGNLACNAAGPRALKYGTPRENTLGLEAVTGEGQAIRTGCYTTKGVVGLDLTRLLIGSEGTLAIITEATLKLTPLPEAVATLRAAYTDMHAAAAAVSRLMAQPVVPRVLEFLDGAALELLRARDPGDRAPGRVRKIGRRAACKHVPCKQRRKKIAGPVRRARLVAHGGHTRPILRHQHVRERALSCGD